MITKITKEQSLEFVLNKVKEIGYAMFKADIPSELQLPNNIISTLKTSIDGSIWFFTSCNKHYVDYMEKEFNASLDYYKKGTDSRLHIDGIARIIETEAADASVVDKSFNNIILIKLTIGHAEYFQSRVSKTTLKEKITDFISELFTEQSYKTFDFPKMA